MIKSIFFLAFIVCFLQAALVQPDIVYDVVSDRVAVDDLVQIRQSMEPSTR